MVTEQAPRSGPDDAVVQPDPPGNVTSPLVANATDTPPTELLWASRVGAVAVEVSVPLAVTEVGVSPTVTVVAGPAVSVRVAVPEWVAAVAVMVSVSAVVEALMVTEQMPSPA